MTEILLKSLKVLLYFCLFNYILYNKFIKKKEDSFGENSLFHYEKMGYNAKTKTLAQIGFIPLESFLQIMSEFPEDHVKFNKIFIQTNICF